MTRTKKEYRLVAVVGGKDIASAWKNGLQPMKDELQIVQDAQVSGQPIRLRWLGIASGRDVTAVFIEERETASPPVG